MRRYPKEAPIFEITKGCPGCVGLHTTGVPTQYGGMRIDVYSCQWLEPFDLSALRPLTDAAREMYRYVKHGGVDYPRMLPV